MPEPQHTEPQPPWQQLAPLLDLATPMALRVAATLGLADLLADGPRSADDLAKQAGADPDALTRMLRLLVTHWVFTEPEPGRFALNGTAALLRGDEPGGMRTRLDLGGFGGQMDLAFTGLLDTVRTGQPAWPQVFGAPLWEYLAANSGFGASFDATMAAGSEYDTALADTYDWSALRLVADVGGGTGTLLAAILTGNPGLRGLLIDLPETVQRGRAHFASAGLADRCEFAGQSFFDPLPPGADAYLLCRVIQDWDDAAAAAILRQCAQAAGQTGRVLVIESHGVSGGDPAAFAEMNLRMLVLTGGQERTIDEYRALAAQADLVLTEVQEAAPDTILEYRRQRP
ncbi:MAG TPA: methyltransferase [Streptosporangiaceae bacterium]|nr:methyltransferase [Streptosporangiaceae bacterium]